MIDTLQRIFAIFLVILIWIVFFLKITKNKFPAYPWSYRLQFQWWDLQAWWRTMKWKEKFKRIQTWIKLPKRRIVHSEEYCYKCKRDDLPMRWDIEAKGRFTLEEGWLCVKCMGDSDQFITELYIPIIPIGTKIPGNIAKGKVNGKWMARSPGSKRRGE